MVRCCWKAMVVLVLAVASAWGQQPASSGSKSNSEKAPAPVVSDLSLSAGGTLKGAVVNTSGTPRVGATVTLRQANREVAQVRCDEKGRFEARGLRGGVYQVECGKTVANCRLWSGAAAPPTAGRSLLLVDVGEVVRGQQPLGNLLSDPLLIGTITAAAVAIPVIIHNSQSDDAPPSS